MESVLYVFFWGSAGSSESLAQLARKPATGWSQCLVMICSYVLFVCLIINKLF